MTDVKHANGTPVISFVFSFRNEEENIRELIARIDSVFAPLPEDYELLFINDCSTDRSLELLIEESARNGRVRILNMAARFGVFECMMAGFEAASGNAVIYMDADLQDPPELIPAILEQWRRGADVVHTVRTKRRGESQLKMWLTKQAYKVIQYGSAVRLPVNAGDYKLLSRRAVDCIVQIKESDPYIRGLVSWIGFNQATVEYERAPRHAGRTHFPFFSRNPWKTFVLGVTSFSFLPVYLVGAVGVGGVTTAFVLAAAGGVIRLLFGYPIPWYLWLLDAALLLWASVVLAIGIVGLYIVRIYKDGRGRPRYIVRERIGFAD